MFNSARDIFNLDSLSHGHPNRHIIRVDSYPEPQINIYDHSTGEISVLEHDPVDIHASMEVMCSGSWDSGVYSPCPTSHKLGSYTLCQDCALPMVRYLECIFEPKCEGERCMSELCIKEHAVYLAFFSDMPKVGMSTSGRVLTRLREQGADGYSIVARVPNRYKARRLERSISKNLDVRQSYRSSDLLPILANGADFEGMEKAYDDLALEIERVLDIECSPLQTLEYDLGRLDQAPVLMETAGHHYGDYLGSKGRFLIYLDGKPRAFRMKGLEGRFLLDVI